jgi:DNA polymerase III epsilon subunit-like protein
MKRCSGRQLVSIHPPEISLRDRDLCFIDTETTGSRIGYHELIELAAIRTSADGFTLKGEWSAKICPDFPERITPVAQKLNGFLPETWSGASVSSEALWAGFVKFVSGCVPVCHNPSFDRAFITLAAAQAGVIELGLDYHWIGTESLAWPIYHAGLIPKLSLVDICRFVGVPPEPAVHGASNGASACREVYLRLFQYYEVSQHRDLVSASIRGPQNLDVAGPGMVFENNRTIER